MKVKGSLVKKLQIVKGKKGNKNWIKQEFLINTGNEYTPEICIQLFGQDKVDLLKPFEAGQEIEVSINVHSKHYRGRYYHSVDGWKIEEVEYKTTN